MRVIVTTCDSHRHLLPEFADRFNKYWSPRQPVDVVCFEPVRDLPENFTCHSMGRQRDFGKADWTTPVRGFVEGLFERQFVLMLEDYHLTAPVPRSAVFAYSRLFKFLTVAKFDLSRDRARHPHKMLETMLVSEQDAPYRTSVQAAIWRTSYFLRYCVPGRTVWDFELKGSKEARNDGQDILGTREGVVHYTNASGRTDTQ